MIPVMADMTPTTVPAPEPAARETPPVKPVVTPPKTVIPPPPVDPPALVQEQPTRQQPEPIEVPLPVAPPPAPSLPSENVAITIKGDALRVILRSAEGSFTLPGEVPPDSYQMTVFFDELEPVEVGRIEVLTGKPTTLNCVARLRVCR